ncbi:hypothetical protein CcI49_23175 [Frankia sp. CcI49]|uniref:hypothetical protein n=1 Tax=Frankia sp. CcI49 TaxID=1745382 RepID=UPI000975D38E|nr:hypothetical protein [Frankia sp. CcI49]ONH58360.1 hypothetical protein CcI49_23175 [Frankia sp. CcI49]
MSAEVDREALIAHLARAHPNLLTGSGVPLPGGAELDAVSVETLVAVHEANHLPRWREHPDDDWLTRDWGRP